MFGEEVFDLVRKYLLLFMFPRLYIHDNNIILTYVHKTINYLLIYRIINVMYLRDKEDGLQIFEFSIRYSIEENASR